MKVITWNVNKASLSRNGVWEVLEREDADIVLLQEVTRIPDQILRRYNCHARFPKFFGGHNARFQTAVLSRWKMSTTPFLTSELRGVNELHDARYGWIHECVVYGDEGKRYQVVSVHSPAFAVPRGEIDDADFRAIKLKKNPKLWFTEILWSLLQNASLGDETNWIVGGDFNSSVNFDRPHDRGNREIIDRLTALGLTDCLSHHNGHSVPTFQHSSKSVEHQLDYLYVNKPLLNRLTSPRVPGREEVFDTHPRVSDHLPIVCEFD